MSNNFYWSSSNKNNSSGYDGKRDNREKEEEADLNERKYGRWESNDDDDKNGKYGYDNSPGYQSSPDRSPPQKNHDNQYYFTKNYDNDKDSSWSSSRSNDENKYSGSSSGSFYGN